MHPIQSTPLTYTQCTVHCTALSSWSFTPVLIDRFENELHSHPDCSFVRQLIHKLTHGCSIGYEGAHFAHTCNNLPSAFQQPEVLNAALTTECATGCILGPYVNHSLPNLCCSGLGLIPKHDGSRCTIYHLSAPRYQGINDFINLDKYTLTYCSVDHALAIVNQLGKGAFLAKICLKNSFRLIPVCQDDWNLLGIYWKGRYTT